MYQINILVIGSLKSGPLKILVNEYLKRLNQYAKIETIEISEEKFRAKEDMTRVKTKEAKKIRQKLNKEAFKILLTERGKQFTSEEFSRHLNLWSENESRPIQIIIGGPLGLDESLAKDVDFQLALSKMTFPHDLAHVFLLEQLYRAFTIQTGKTYHY
jgi:23S rRNA (pseudouridine1915-N3)-methyltransferase